MGLYNAAQKLLPCVNLRLLTGDCCQPLTCYLLHCSSYLHEVHLQHYDRKTCLLSLLWCFAAAARSDPLHASFPLRYSFYWAEAAHWSFSRSVFFHYTFLFFVLKKPSTEVLQEHCIHNHMSSFECCERSSAVRSLWLIFQGIFAVVSRLLLWSLWKVMSSLCSLEFMCILCFMVAVLCFWPFWLFTNCGGSLRLLLTPYFVVVVSQKCGAGKWANEASCLYFSVISETKVVFEQLFLLIYCWSVTFTGMILFLPVCSFHICFLCWCSLLNVIKTCGVRNPFVLLQMFAKLIIL